MGGKGDTLQHKIADIKRERKGVPVYLRIH